MPDEIQPALTPEEWRIVELRIHGKPIGGNVRGWVVADLPEEHQYAAMAVANAHLPDGDPRKITKSDLAGLDASDKNEYGPELERLAKKLQALLPPNK